MKTQPKWNDLSREKQDRYLKILWDDHYTELATAEFLGTTKGTIVRRRATLKLENTSERQERSEKRFVNPKRFWDLVELDEIRKREARGEELVFDGE